MTTPERRVMIPRAGGQRTPLLSLKDTLDCSCPDHLGRATNGSVCSGEGFRWNPQIPPLRFDRPLDAP